jgi:hypothetical protein
MAAGLTTRKRAPDPHAAELAEIDSVWGPDGWFVTAHEDTLRTDPDTHLHDANARR